MADENFHISIAMVTRNPVLLSAYQSFTAANAIAEWASIRQRLLTGDRRAASRDEHHKILAAIRNRDSGAAGEAVCEHLQYIASALHYCGLGAAGLQAHGLIAFDRRK